MTTMLRFTFTTTDFLSSDDAAFAVYDIFQVPVETKDDQTLCLWLENIPANLEELLSELRAQKINLVEQKEFSDQNWLKNCPELFESLKIGQFEIIPQESLTAADGLQTNTREQLRIIPGTGFGTGHHPTTAMLIELLQLLPKDPFTNTKQLDLGTGSGLLAIVMEKLFGGEIDAIDIDDLAIENARDNLKLNHCQNINLKIGGIELAQGNYQLVVANLYAELLVDFQEKIASLLPSGGTLLLSGIMNEKAASVINEFSNLNWQLNTNKSKDNWTALVLTRK